MNERVIARLFVAGRARTKGHIQPVHVAGRGGRKCTFGGGKDRPLTQAWMKTLGRGIQSALGIRMARGVEVNPTGRGRRAYVKRADADPYAGPVEIHCFFRFDRTASAAEAAAEGEVWASHDTEWPTARSIGDEDTLRRAVLDALTKSGVIADDSLSIGGLNFKRWTLAGEEAGVAVVVVEARPADDLLEIEEAWMEHPIFGLSNVGNGQP